MKKWMSIFVAAVFILSGILPVSAVEDGTGEAAQGLQKMEYREGEALVKVSVSGKKTRARLFAGLSFDAETLMDIGKFRAADASHDDSGVRSSQQQALLNGSVSARTSSQDGTAVTEEKILLVKSDTLSTEELMEKLEQDPEVEYAEPNYMFRFASLTDDTYITRQWHLQTDNDTEKAAEGSSRAACLWESSSVGDTAEEQVPVVAVVDSGIDYNHSDLTGMLWDDGNGNCGVDFSDPADSEGDGPRDYDGHGTHVAGIIGAEHNNGVGVSGMSKDVKLMVLKISDDSGSFDLASAVEAYNYILEKKSAGVNIIAANNSWGGYYYSRILEEVFDTAGDNGVVSIAASGNESIDHDTNLNSPEGGDRTMFLLANASDEKGRAADFSDYGLVDTDLYAQGAGIFSTVIREDSNASEEGHSGYGYRDGTSAAAAVTTGAVTLLYDYYDVAEKPAEEQKEALAEIRARIAGGVTRTEEMKNLCVSGGYLNLEKAVASPYPVPDALEQDGSTAAITGYFFGSTGVLEMDGKQVKVKSWSDRKITFTLPDGTSEGLHEFRITDKSKPEYGAEQYGRDKLWVEEVAATPSGDFFEALTPPDYDALGVTRPLQETSYKLAVYDGKIYAAQDGLHEEGQNHPAILVYHEETGEWSVITADPVEMGEDVFLELTAGEDGIYLVESSLQETWTTRFRAFKMTEEDTFEMVGEAFDTDLSIDHSVACDGKNIWVVGGQYLDKGEWEAAPDARILCFDTKTGQWEQTDISLKTARYSAVAEATDGKLMVTGGINKSGRLERTTEIIHLKTGKAAAGADLPEMEETQEISFASGAYDGKLIISGMFDTKDHTADTYVYDLQSDTWKVLKPRLIDTKAFLLDGAVSGAYFYVYGVTLDGGNKKDVFRRLKVMDLPPDEEDNSGENQAGGQGETGGQGGADPEKPDVLDTGDRTAIMLWLTLMTLAAAGAVTAALFKRRHKT